MPKKMPFATLAPIASVAFIVLAAAVSSGSALAQQPSSARAQPPAAAASGVPDETQPGLSAGEIKAIREFKMLDFNGDGKLSRSEVKLFPRLAAAFDEADTDHDGFASYAEVRAFAAKYRAERDRKKAEQAAGAQAPTPTPTPTPATTAADAAPAAVPTASSAQP